MDKFRVNVGIGMLLTPFLITGLVFLISALIGLGISALIGICVVAYIGTALFLILSGCLKEK